MAWCRPGDKPLSEPMMVRSPTHICVTRLQWVIKHGFPLLAIMILLPFGHQMTSLEMAMNSLSNSSVFRVLTSLHVLKRQDYMSQSPCRSDVSSQRPLLLTKINLIPAWLRYQMPSKVCDEITYSFPNFRGCTVEVWDSISNFIPPIIMDREQEATVQRYVDPNWD